MLSRRGCSALRAWPYREIGLTKTKTMKSPVRLLIAVILPSQAFAEDYKPDAENGAFLHGDHCVDYHMVDILNALYLRENRVANERIRLIGQVSAGFHGIKLGMIPL